jgi:hypothetical protein
VEHKAFVFDFTGFDGELRSILEKALEDHSVEGLASFIDENLGSLTDPYEGEPLSDTWREAIEAPDAHQCGDFALTKYYSPREDIGLGYGWEKVQELLLEQLGNDAPLLGSTVGPPGNLFDPGKMGSYFQSGPQVEMNLQALTRLRVSGDVAASVERLRTTLESAVGRGLYVTF